MLKAIMEIVDDHSHKAAESEYDRGVAIRAIAAAREEIDHIASEISDRKCKDKIVEALELLKLGYNDTDGQYTNGKGVIGSLIDDIRIKVL